jgi:hypothetical protein
LEWESLEVNSFSFFLVFLVGSELGFAQFSILRSGLWEFLKDFVAFVFVRSFQLVRLFKASLDTGNGSKIGFFQLVGERYQDGKPSGSDNGEPQLLRCGD